MVSQIEGELPVVPRGREPQVSKGALAGRRVEAVKKAGLYCVAMPLGFGAKVLSLAGSAADQLTFRPVVSGLSTVGWLGGQALYYAGRVTEVTGKILQKDLARRIALEASKYTEEYFRKALGVRSAVGDTTAHVVSYIPFVGGPAGTLERGERAAEAALSARSSGILSRIWKAGASILPFAGQVVEYGGKAAAFVSRKFADLTYIGMTEPSRMNHIFQNFRDKMDSYAFNLLEGLEPPRPEIPLCTEGDFKRFIKLGKQARKKIFQAVTSSPWLRIDAEKKKEFAEALKRRGVRRTDEDRQALRVMYSAYLCLTDLQKERERLQVGGEAFEAFLQLPSEEQDKMLFIVLSSPTWDVPLRERESFEAALQQVQTARKHREPIEEGAGKKVREFLGMYGRLPKNYVQRALTSQDFDQKLRALDPALARIRLMNIVRENSADLGPNERRMLAKYRKITTADDWLTLDEPTQKALEKIIFFHFNRLSLKDQGKLYDITPGLLWDLQEEFRAEFFLEGQKLLLEQNIHEFEGIDPKEFMKDYSNVVRFTEALNQTLRLGGKIRLCHMVTPPPAVIAFTAEQLRAEIAKVKTRLEAGEPLGEHERRELSFYLMMLESTLKTREAFVPIEEFETPLTPGEVFARQAPSPVDMERLQKTVGSEVVTSGVLYSASRYLGTAEEWTATGAGKLFEKLAQGMGLASNPAVIQLMFGALSFGISLFVPEENLIMALKALGLEEKVRAMEAGAAQVFPLLLKLTGPLERLLLSGVTSTKAWMTAITQAMKIVGDPSSTPEQIKEIALQLTQARDEVCAAAASVGGSEMVKDLTSATDLLLEQCALGGAAGLIQATERQIPTLSPALVQAADQVKRALQARKILPPNKGILEQLKRLWLWGTSFMRTPDPESIAQLEDLAQKLTLLEEAGHASERVQSMQTLLEYVPFAKTVVSTGAAQAGASAYVSAVRPLLGVIQQGLEAEQGVLSLGTVPVVQHLKWVDLAREAERYASEGGEALLRQAEQVAGKDGWLSSVAKATSYALPVAYSIMLGTGGFVLTPLLLTFAANDLLPGAAAYLAPRARPMWNYLGRASLQASQLVGKGFADVTRGIGYYLQHAINSGRYVDERRIQNFKQVLSDKEREFIFHAVRGSGKISPADGEELEDLWTQYRAKKLSPAQEQEVITRILLGFEELTAEDLLAINPFYFSMLAPYVQERFVDIVERHHPLTAEEKKSENYLELLVERFKALPPEVRAEIHRIQPWEYHRLSEEQQRELRFLIVHSKAYREKMEAVVSEQRGVEVEEVQISPSDMFRAYNREPKGEELREFLGLYRDLSPQDLSGITPQQLIAAGEAKILHALQIVETYHARWIRTLVEEQGIDVTLLRKLFQGPHPLSPVGEVQKSHLVEALASLCRLMPEHQQVFLLDMTKEEAIEMGVDKKWLDACTAHLSSCIKDPQTNQEFTAFLVGCSADKVEVETLCSLFNALTPTQKAEFRQKIQPRADAIEEVRKSVIAINLELMELTEVAEKNKYSLESLITAAELLRFKGKEGMTHQDESKIQRYELNASALSEKLMVIEKRIGELLAVRARLVEGLERAGMKDIPPLPLEEVEKHNPQTKNELLLLSHIVDLEVKAYVNFVQEQPSLEELEKARHSLLVQNEHRMSEGRAAIAEMEHEAEQMRQATAEGSSIARAKARASLSLLEKRIKFERFYLQTFQNSFLQVEKAVEERRSALSSYR